MRRSDARRTGARRSGLPYGVPECGARRPTRPRTCIRSTSTRRARGSGSRRSRTACSGSSGRCCRRATSGRTASPAATRSSTCRRAIGRVPHYDHAAPRAPLSTRSRSKLEDEARDWFTDAQARRDRGAVPEAEAIGRDMRTSAVSVAARDGAAAPEEARPQRSVRVRLDAQVEAVLRRARRLSSSARGDAIGDAHRRSLGLAACSPCSAPPAAPSLLHDSARRRRPRPCRSWSARSARRHPGKMPTLRLPRIFMPTSYTAQLDDRSGEADVRRRDPDHRRGQRGHAGDLAARPAT